MSETNQEDLSVEDILSSIKNILVDEEGEQTAPLSQEKKEEDVLDLESSMIIDNNSLPQTSDIENFLSDMTEPVIAAEPVSEQAQKLADSIDVKKTVDIADQISLEDLQTPKAEPAELSPAAPAAADGVKEETIDTSASIINNFAKVFAEKQQQLQAQHQPSSIEKEVSGSVEHLGITDMVKETIINQDKQNLDSHFEQIASSIIAEQTQQWLNANLAAIVEKTVAKEIERVIAKVGS